MIQNESGPHQPRSDALGEVGLRSQEQNAATISVGTA